MENSEVKEKKKNSKNKMLIVLLMLIIFLVIVLGMIIFVNVYSTKKYQNIEKSMELNVENYITLKKYILDTKDKSIITLKEMKKYHLVSENKCDGYVVMSYSKDDNDFIKNAYIKCGKYKTKGYKEKKAKKNVINLKLDLDSDEKLKKLDLYYDEKNKHVVTSSQKTSYSGRYDCKYLGQYDCKTSKCKYIKRTENVDIYGDLYSDSVYNMVLLYDDEYILYNYETKEIYKTTISEDELKNIKLASNINGFFGVLGDNKFYSIKYNKVLTIEGGTITTVDAKYENLEVSDKNNNPKYVINVNTEKKLSAYVTESEFNSENYSESNIEKKYKSNYVVRNDNGYKSGGINIILYKGGYMSLSSGNGFSVMEETAGTYEIKDNKLIYKRLYDHFNGNDTPKRLKTIDSYDMSYTEEFDINKNELSSNDYTYEDGDGITYKVILKEQ